MLHLSNKLKLGGKANQAGGILYIKFTKEIILIEGQLGIFIVLPTKMMFINVNIYVLKVNMNGLNVDIDVGISMDSIEISRFSSAASPDSMTFSMPALCWFLSLRQYPQS